MRDSLSYLDNLLQATNVDRWPMFLILICLYHQALSKTRKLSFQHNYNLTFSAYIRSAPMIRPKEEKIQLSRPFTLLPSCTVSSHILSIIH